jgi:hypothetical protein
MGHSIKLKTFGANDEDTKFSSVFSLVCDFIHNAIIKMNMLLWLLYNFFQKKQKQILHVSVCLVLKVQWLLNFLLCCDSFLPVFMLYHVV